MTSDYKIREVLPRRHGDPFHTELTLPGEDAVVLLAALDDALEFRTDDDSAPWWIDAGEWDAQTDGMEKARDLLDKRIRWLRSRGRLDEVFTVKFPYAAARTLMLALKEVTEDREQWEDEEVDWVDARDIPAWRAQAAEMEDVLGELEEFGYRLRWSDRVR